MSFLEPLILAALPLMALPVIIHLIHRRRHRNVHWAAMMFLVRAQRMNKGMARLRHILILLMRTLAIGALIFAISRPLASGWLSGAAMGRPDATLILLDRSASMEAQNLQTGESKRSTALRKLTEVLEKRGHGDQLVLIDSAGGEARSVDSPRDLLDLPQTAATATSADIPGMLETGLAYLEANESGRADVWICSDLSANDWDAQSGRWAAIRQGLASSKGVHAFLLSYAEGTADNLSIRVANVRRRQSGKRAELVLDVLVRAQGRSTDSDGVAHRVPIEVEVHGVRSVVEVELDSEGASLQGHRIPIDARRRSGWGAVALPADANPLDNRFYFAFSEPPVRKTIIVSDDARTGEAFRRAVAIPMDPTLQHDAAVIPSARTSEIDWESTGLLIWHAPLPGGLVAEQIERFVDSGRVVVFCPPGGRDEEELLGSRWGDWRETAKEAGEVSWWRGDADLLAHVGSGDALPLDELRVYCYRTIESRGTPLARLGDGSPLLTRVATDRGGVYFCSTLPTAQFSSLERDGIAFYAMLQRALADGTRALDAASARAAGQDALGDRGDWEPVAPEGDTPTLSQRGLHAGVFRSGEYWAAVNRSAAEDDSAVAPVATVDALFAGTSYERIDDAVGDTAALVSEIWRTFLLAMALALILEAALSLPKTTRAEPPLASEFAAVSGETSRAGAAS